MSAYMRVNMILGKLCDLCHFQTYARRKTLLNIRARRLSSIISEDTKVNDEVHTEKKTEVKTKVKGKGAPNLKMFPRDIVLDPAFSKSLDQGTAAHRKHPGITKTKIVPIPTALEEAANVVLEKHSEGYKSLSQKAEELSHFIHTRVAPREGHAYQKKLETIYNQLYEKELHRINHLENQPEPEELEKSQNKIERKAVSLAQKGRFTWKQLTFDAETAMVYMMCRLAQNYNVLLKIFHELRSYGVGPWLKVPWDRQTEEAMQLMVCKIKKRDPKFMPGTIYNLGSGTGSAVWAANSVWPSKTYEFYCVDSSGHMNTLARLLLQGGVETHKMCIPGVYFRQFHSSDKGSKFKMVVCDYTLLELNNKEERLKLISSLWKKTEDYLVLVEVGNAAGYKVILEARDHILKKKQKQLEKKKEGIEEDLEGHVFAPCPHDSACPKLEYNKNHCLFQTNYLPLYLGAGKKSTNKQTETYSYMVLKKGPRKENKSWPRVVYKTLPRKHLVLCHLCCPDSSLQYCAITKNPQKYSKHLYRCARSSAWGDRLPVNWPRERKELTNIDDMTETDNIVGEDIDELSDDESEKNSDRN